MHFAPEMSLGNALAWLIAASGFCFTCGRLVTVLNNLVDRVAELRQEFREHCEEDDRRHEQLMGFVAQRGTK